MIFSWSGVRRFCRFDWFQSFSHVTVEIQAADVLEQHAFIEIRKDEVQCTP